MKTPQDKNFKEFASIYTDYIDKNAREKAILRGLQMAYRLGVSDGIIKQLDKQIKRLTKKN